MMDLPFTKMEKMQLWWVLIRSLLSDIRSEMLVGSLRVKHSGLNTSLSIKKPRAGETVWPHMVADGGQGKEYGKTGLKSLEKSRRL